jgi:hypothetical protein
VLFNDAGAIGGSVNLTVNKATGTIIAAGSTGPIATGENWKFAVNSAGATDSAYMLFNCNGAFAAYFGVQPDRTWRIGGSWLGANSYQILHEANSFQIIGAGSALNTPAGVNNVIINGAAAPGQIGLDTTQAAGTQHALSFTNATKLRWQVRDSAATFAFAHYDDSGTYLGDSWQLDRASRTFYVQGPTVMPRTDNATVLGNATYRFTALYAVTGTIQTSDARMKKDVQDSALGLAFIESLRPISYKWIIERNIAEPTGDGSDVDAPMKVTPIPGVRTHWGLLAQEVQQAVTTAGVDFGGYVENRENPDAPLGLNYSEFVAPLIKAVQELSARVRDLEARLP